MTVRLPLRITDAVYNGAANGATPVYKTFIGSAVVFAYITPPGIRTYGLGVDFRFSGYNTDPDRKSTRLNSSHIQKSRMPSSA